MVPASWNNKLTYGNPVRKRKLERFPYEENASNDKEKHCLTSEFVSVENDGTLHLSSRIIGDDGHYYGCVVCDSGGDLLCCDTCPCVYHLECLSPPLELVPAGNWQCPSCDKQDLLMPIKHLKSSIRENTSLYSKVKHATMTKLDLSMDMLKKIMSSSCPSNENPENQIGGEKSQAYCKTNQIKVYRRTRFKRSVTKGENLDSSEFYKVHVQSENSIEIQDPPVISHMPIGENITARFDCSSSQTRSSKKTNRKSKKDAFGSARQEEKGTKEQVGAIATQDVNGDTSVNIRAENEPVQDIVSGSQHDTMVEVWFEGELDALWIGVRRHGQGNWEAMLKDPMLKFSKFKTSQALSEMWKAERQKIIDVENIQEAGPKRIMKIFTRPISLVQSPAQDTAEASGQLLLECGPSYPPSKEDGNPTDGISGGSCSAGMDVDDCSTTESELSFKGWIQGKETSSEGTISD